MISLNITSNLDYIDDCINTITNDIDSIITNSIEDAKSYLTNDLVNTFGNGASEAIVDCVYSNGIHDITVSNLNEYHIYNATGMSSGDVLDYTKNTILEYIQNALNEAGY